MDRVYEEAFAEVDEIFKNMPIELISKIPIKFRKIISDNKANDYKVEIKKDFEEKDLRKETIILLGLIYREFLADPEEKEKLQAEDVEQLRKIEEDLKEQYNIENIFQKRKEKNYEENLIVYKEPNFFGKIVNFFKKIFSKNKF